MPHGLRCLCMPTEVHSLRMSSGAWYGHHDAPPPGTPTHRPGDSAGMGEGGSELRSPPSPPAGAGFLRWLTLPLLGCCCSHPPHKSSCHESLLPLAPTPLWSLTIGVVNLGRSPAVASGVTKESALSCPQGQRPPSPSQGRALWTWAPPLAAQPHFPAATQPGTKGWAWPCSRLSSAQGTKPALECFIDLPRSSPALRPLIWDRL